MSERLLSELNGKGVPVDGSFNHVIDNSGILHSLNGHGGNTEQSRGQIPITEEDFNLVDDVVNNYDGEVEVEILGGQQPTILKYHKAYPDGTIVYVEEVRKGRKELALKTMYKRKGGVTLDEHLNKPSSHTPEATSSSNTALSESKGNANIPIEQRGHKEIQSEIEKTIDELYNLYKEHPELRNVSEVNDGTSDAERDAIARIKELEAKTEGLKTERDNALKRLTDEELQELIDEKGLRKIERQATREGGQFLILSPNDGSAAALSALPSDLSSADKVTENQPNDQAKVEKTTDSEDKTAAETPKAEKKCLVSDERMEQLRDGEGFALTDEEKVARLDAIDAIVPSTYKDGQMEPQTKEESKQAYLTLGKATNNRDGREVEFYVSGFKKIYKDDGLFQKSIPLLKEAFENSVLAFSEPDLYGGTVRPDNTVHRVHQNIVAFHHYIGKVRLTDGRDYFVRYTVQEERGANNGTHSFFVTDTALYEKNQTGQNEQSGIVQPSVGTTLPITTRGTNQNHVVDAKLQNFFDEARRLKRNSHGTEGEKVSVAREVAEYLNTPVRIITDASEVEQLPEARQRRAKGWFDPQTGEVVIVAPNNADAADIANTVVHEVAGHKGLRQLVGEERFADFLDKVYRGAEDSIKQAITTNRKLSSGS